MEAQFKTIRHLSHQKKLKALSELSVKDLKLYLDNFKVKCYKKAKKEDLISLALRKT